MGVGGYVVTRIAAHTRANARELRKNMTPQERRLWPKLREVNRMLGTHFRRQAPVEPYIADFAEFGRRLVIEVDGGGHGGPRDQARDAWFEAQGFTVLRFWNNEIDGNMDGVMQVVLDALEACPPPPSPPHEGEGRRGGAFGAPFGKDAEH
ncbi:endonuclease domain-containing protein [Defluviimonas aestuarii]|uniref:endonuclease domain-containing protein n=1 Tax=Albidovulum aestuarii TaxID=1130726 RepID=UPI00249ADC95|nr:endonuclease domain-containing protein [Defluviimonas aestuarii]MDI3336932.1 endonuclease domain-containing protein [Defluviimonas aestuarii]